MSVTNIAHNEHWRLDHVIDIYPWDGERSDVWSLGFSQAIMEASPRIVKILEIMTTSTLDLGSSFVNHFCGDGDSRLLKVEVVSRWSATP